MNADLKLEAKLVKREKSYRSAKVGCIFLSVVSFAAMLLALTADPSDKTFISGVSSQIMFWLALAYVSHARLQHITTIKRHNAKLDERL